MSAVPTIPDKPELAFRIGITGTRDISPDHRETIQAQIETVLKHVRERINLELTSSPRAAAAFASDAGGLPTPRLTLLSPLAKGADRLAAYAALAEDYKLFVPLPFQQGEYEKDFSDGGSLNEFQELLSKANAGVLTLDGARPAGPLCSIQQARSYEAVGHFVVRNCDLLIAVWDGEASRGWGGTAEIVRFAAASRRPIWWIDTRKPDRQLWIRRFQDVYGSPDHRNAFEALNAYLRASVEPPKIDLSADHRGLLDKLAHRIFGAPRDPMPDYFARSLPRKPSSIKEAETGSSSAPARPSAVFRAHTRLLRILSARPMQAWRHCGKQGLRASLMKAAASSPSAPEPANPWREPQDYWRRQYAFADERAEVTGQRYRSVYVWIFITIALSLIAATAALTVHPDWKWHTIFEVVAIIIEGVGLLFILFLLLANSSRDWHQRWIDCRLLAEMCRGQRSVSRLGWTLPGQLVSAMAVPSVQESEDNASEIQQLPHHQEHRKRPESPERATWVAWVFSAMLRAAPLPTGVIDKAAVVKIQETIRKELVRDQLIYHKRTARRLEAAAHRLAFLGELSFGVVILIILVKSIMVVPHAFHEPFGHHVLASLIRALGFVAVLLPTVAAASVGIRAYAELTLLARRSRKMVKVMLGWYEDTKRVNPGNPVASADLGEATHTVVSEMLLETDGWAHTFRIKVPEAG